MEAFSALLALCAGIHRSPVNSPHKAQWRGALMFSSSCALINGWVNTREAGDLRRHHPHYDVTVMTWVIHYAYNIPYMKWTYIIIHMYCVQKQNNIALRCLCYLNPSFRFIIAKWNLFFCDPLQHHITWSLLCLWWSSVRTTIDLDSCGLKSRCLCVYIFNEHCLLATHPNFSIAEAWQPLDKVNVDQSHPNARSYYDLLIILLWNGKSQILPGTLHIRYLLPIEQHQSLT